MSTQGEIFPQLPSYSAATLQELSLLTADAVGIEVEHSAQEAGRAWPALPSAALYGIAGDVVRTIAPHSEADPAAILMQLLVAASNIIGSGPHCSVESTRHGLNLYSVLVGETSKGRKGTSWGHIERLCARVDPQWTRERVTSGLSSAEGLIAEVQDDEEPPKDRRLLVIQSEFSSVLRVIARDGNNLSSILRDAWDSGKLRTLVKREPQQATGAHISMVGHITRLELLRYLSDTEQHNGFANRILWCAIKRSKCLPEGGSVPEVEMDTLAHRLRNVVAWAQRAGEIEIRRDDAARGLWAAVYPRLSAGLPGLLGAATSRAEAQVLRLSAVYAVLDCSPTVRVGHLQAALAVWDYCAASAKYIFGNAIGDPVADRISEALKSADAEGVDAHTNQQPIRPTCIDPAHYASIGAAYRFRCCYTQDGEHRWPLHRIVACEISAESEISPNPYFAFYAYFAWKGKTVRTFSEMAEEWVQKNLPAEVPPQDASGDVRNQALEEWREAFALWLEFSCVRHSRHFSGLICLYRSFSDWQTKHDDWAPSIDTFAALFTDQDFLIGDVLGSKLVSGLAFRDDL